MDPAAGRARSSSDVILDTNDCLPWGVTAKVDNTLCKPGREWERLGREMAALGRTLEGLQAECDILQSSISGYAMVQAPIRRLPAEILDDIFYHCIPTHRNPVMSFADAPLLLMCVCRAWKQAVLSSPRLWSRLHIALYLPRRGGGGDSDAAEEREAAMRLAWRRLKGFEVWLSRSGNSLLSISLSYGGNDRVRCSRRDNLKENVIKHVFETLFSVAARIEELELVVPFQTYEILLSGISSDRLPIMRKLRLCFTISRIADRPNNVVATPFVQAPLLQSLSVRWSWRSIPYELGDDLSTKNLTVLSLHSSITSIAAFKLLRTCHSLRRCKMTITDSDHLDIAHVHSDDGLAYLPDLLSLTLSVDDNTDRQITSMYGKIHAPRLIQFGYRQSEGGHDWIPPVASFTNATPRPTSGIYFVLIKSSVLTKLTLDVDYYTIEDFYRCLRSSEQVTHLEVGSDNRSIAEDQCFDYGSEQSFDLKLLVPYVDKAISGVEDLFPISRSPEEEILLPKLENFIGHKMPKHTSDKTVENFVLGRLGPAATRRGISPLKRVCMRFFRRPEIDVEASIKQLTNGVLGTEGLRVELKYSKPRSDRNWQSIFSGIPKLPYSPWLGIEGDADLWTPQLEPV